MDDCIFCKIIAGEIPAFIIHEDEESVAFMDINPATPGHVLILPKTHIRDIEELDEEQAGKLMMVAKAIGQKQKSALGADGFNIVQNNGKAAGQTVPHFHIHVIPRYAGGPQVAAWTPTSPTREQLSEIYIRLKD